MHCESCGEEGWFKTCRFPGGTLAVLCEPCWEASGHLVIVPGERVVTARCFGCGTYGNPRDFEGVVPAGRKDAFGGKCRRCGDE